MMNADAESEQMLPEGRAEEQFEESDVMMNHVLVVPAEIIGPADDAEMRDFQQELQDIATEVATANGVLARSANLDVVIQDNMNANRYMTVRLREFYRDGPRGVPYIEFNDLRRDVLLQVQYHMDIQNANRGSDSLIGDIAMGLTNFNIVSVTVSAAFTDYQINNVLNRVPDQYYAFNSFDLKLMSAKYSSFTNESSALSGQGVCILDVLEWIRNDGYKHRRICEDQVNILQEQSLHFVKTNFTPEEIKDIYKGNIFLAMLAYKRVYPELDIGFYDVHSDQAMDLITNELTGKVEVKVTTLAAEQQILIERIKSSGGDVNLLMAAELKKSIFAHTWWIIYEKMHVTPLHRDEMEEMYKELVKKNKVTSLIRKKLKGEVVIQTSSSEGEEDQEEEKKREGRRRSEEASQVFSLNRCINDDYIQRQLRKMKGKGLTLEQVETLFQYNLKEGTPEMEAAREAVKKKILKTGVAALDFETVIDNQSADLIGNVKPIVLCVYGYLYQDILVKNRIRRLKEGASGEEVAAEELREKRKKKARVVRFLADKSFVGYDCAHQFVQWLMDEGVIAQASFSVDQSAASQKKNHNKYLKVYKNIFVAHNGAHFDFRFILDVLSRFSNMDVVGTLSDLKKVTFKNVSFVDSFQLLPFSLAQLCVSMKTEKKKFPYDLENVTKDNWDEGPRLQSLIKYCRMDCEALLELYMNYITKRATTYFGGRSFPKVIFPSTSSQGALDVLQNCFLQTTLHSFVETLPQERLSYIGGICVPFGTELNFGVSTDINSSYPTAMHNSMPVAPTPAIPIKNFSRVEDVYTQVYEPSPLTVVSSNANREWFDQSFDFILQTKGQQVDTYLMESLDDMTLYYVSFEFPPGTRYPTLVLREDDEQTLLMPLSSGGQLQWIWGVELNLAVNRCGARVFVYKSIKYLGKPVFREFIQTLYQMRLDAKQEEDEVLSLILKLIMNSSYGKLSQKIQPKTVYGHLSMVEDLLAQFKRDGLKIVVHSIAPVLAVKDALFELKYTEVSQEQNQIGSMVRFASYITALARTNLCKGLHGVVNTVDQYYLERGFTVETLPENGCYVKYADTDSIHTSLEQSFTKDELVILDSMESIHTAANKILYEFTTAHKKVHQYAIQKREELLQGTEEEVDRSTDALMILEAIVWKLKQSGEILSVGSSEQARESQHYLDQLFVLTQEELPVICGTEEMSPEWLLKRIVLLKEFFDDYFVKQFLVGEVVQTVIQTYSQNLLFKQLLTIEEEDPREINTGADCPLVPFIDSKICGASKIEKYIIKGIYLGAKQYAVRAFDQDSMGMLKDHCKMKGVQAKHRRYEHYLTMFESLNLTLSAEEIVRTFRESYSDASRLSVKGSSCVTPVQQYRQQQFRVLHTGVRITDVYKFIQPVLTKRIFMGEKGTWSLPYQDPLTWKAAKAQTANINAQLREDYQKAFNEDGYQESYESDQFFSAQKDLVHKKQILIRSISMSGEVKQYRFKEDTNMWVDLSTAELAEGESSQTDLLLLKQFVSAEEVKQRLAVASPIIFNKLNFMNQLESYWELYPLEFIETATQAYLQAASYVVEKYAKLITGQTCMAIETVRRTLVHASFINNLLKALYTKMSPLLKYDLVSPYQSIINLCESKINDCLGAAKVALIQDQVIAIVKEDFAQITALFQDGWGEDGQINSLVQDFFILNQDITQLRRGKENRQISGRYQSFENGIHEATRKRVQKAKEKVYKFLISKRFHKSKCDNYANFILIAQELRRMFEEGEPFKKLVLIFKARERNGDFNKIATLIILARDHILFDPQAFQVERFLETQHKRYLNKSIQLFFEHMYYVYFSEDALTLQYLPSLLGVPLKEIDEIAQELANCFDEFERSSLPQVV